MTHIQKLELATSSKIFALFKQTAPELVAERRFPTAVIVAANLLNNSASCSVFIEITNPEGSQHRYDLDLQSKQYVSKGNWTWINHINIYFNTELIIDMATKQRVIDIPYHGNRICAWRLFANLQSDFIVHLEENLYPRL